MYACGCKVCACVDCEDIELWCSVFFMYLYGHHRDLHGLTHSFPTRRSSDLMARTGPIDDSKMGKATAEEIFANSSRTISASRLPRPRPPSSAGMLIPRKPISA